MIEETEATENIGVWDDNIKVDLKEIGLGGRKLD
jgi:hypothetical protein